MILLGGLLHRQEMGPARIGIEGVAMLVTYLAGFMVLGWRCRRGTPPERRG